MNTSKEYIPILLANLPRIQSQFGVTGLCIFGSVARGDSRPDSDVDILVEMPPKIFLMAALKDYLEGILGSTVDLIRRHTHLSDTFLTQISQDGITLL